MKCRGKYDIFWSIHFIASKSAPEFNYKRGFQNEKLYWREKKTEKKVNKENILLERRKSTSWQELTDELCLKKFCWTFVISKPCWMIWASASELFWESGSTNNTSILCMREANQRSFFSSLMLKLTRTIVQLCLSNNIQDCDISAGKKTLTLVLVELFQRLPAPANQPKMLADSAKNATKIKHLNRPDVLLWFLIF